MNLDENFDIPGYKRIDEYNPKTLLELEESYSKIITNLGEDIHREGLEKTPNRVAKAWLYLTQGYDMDPKAIINSAIFNEDHKEMVIVKNIEMYSVCEHHMLPFYGKAHIGYLPKGKITGLSKFARVVDAFSRRLQVQERLTYQIMECVQECLEPHGVAVVIEAHHMCMMMRGVEKQNSVTTTSSFTGAFENENTRAEFMTLIGSHLH